MFRTRKIRAMAKTDGKTFEEIAREYERQGIEFKFAERKFGENIAHSTQLSPMESDVEVGTDQRKFSHFWLSLSNRANVNAYPNSKIADGFTEAAMEPITFVDKL